MFHELGPFYVKVTIYSNKDYISNYSKKAKFRMKQTSKKSTVLRLDIFKYFFDIHTYMSVKNKFQV